MIYPAFLLAVSAILYLAPLTHALPASHKFGSNVIASQEYPERLPGNSHSSHGEPASRFTTNGSHTHQNSLRDVQFPSPSIFYLPQRRDTPNDDLSRNRASDINLLSNQNGIPPAAQQHTVIPIPNTSKSVTPIPRPTSVGRDKVRPPAMKTGIKASQKPKQRKTTVHRKEGSSVPA